MAGHSQFKNIMHRKGRQDALKAKLFSKLSREISVAASTGLPDPSMNSRLRLAVLNARSENVPKDIIERAIKKGAASDSVNYEEVCYEGYGPGGVAIIIEALTDNRNRTSAEVKSVLNKFGASLGSMGSVSHVFRQVGEISYSVEVGSADYIFETALKAGVDDVILTEEAHVLFCNFEELHTISKILDGTLGQAKSIKIIRQAQHTVSVSEEQKQSLMKLIEVLESNDDVRDIYTNLVI